MQVTSVIAAGSTRVHSPTHQCSNLGVRIRSNTMASHEAAAVCVGPRNFILRVSSTAAQLHDCFLPACMLHDSTFVP
jgi:hypothetical protein